MIKRLPGTLALAALAVLAPMSTHAATSDPLGCDATIHDPNDELDATALRPTIDSTATRLGADLRIRVESTVDGDLDARLDQLVRQCPGWDAADGELNDDMVVVMFSTTEREASVYYGADQGPAVERRAERAVDAMIAEFRGDDYTAGVAAALGELTSTSSTSSDDDEDDGGGGFSGWVIVLIIAGAGIAIYSKVRSYLRGDGGYDDDSAYDDDTSSWSDRRRRRRGFFGGSGSSWRRSSSRRSSSSRRGSRRAGGVSKKW